MWILSTLNSLSSKACTFALQARLMYLTLYITHGVTAFVIDIR